MDNKEPEVDDTEPNIFLFSWDMYGIESIISFKQYQSIDEDNVVRVLKGEQPVKNPLNGIINSIMLRARINSQRYYEIYTVNCDSSMDEDFWCQQWKDYPQATADLIRSHGVKHFGERLPAGVIIR